MQSILNKAINQSIIVILLFGNMILISLIDPLFIELINYLFSINISINMEVIQSTHKIYCQFPLKIKNIKRIEPAFDDSYVVLQEYGNSSFVNIYHINRLGKIVFQSDSYARLDSIVMPEEDKIFVLSKGFILLIDLKLQSQKKIKCGIGEYQWEHSFVFSQKKMFCIQERGEQKMGLAIQEKEYMSIGTLNQLANQKDKVQDIFSNRFTYFSFSSDSVDELVKYHEKQTQKTYKMSVNKINQTSKLLICQLQENECLQFTIHDVVKDSDRYISDVRKFTVKPKTQNQLFIFHCNLQKYDIEQNPNGSISLTKYVRKAHCDKNNKKIVQEKIFGPCIDPHLKQMTIKELNLPKEEKFMKEFLSTSQMHVIRRSTNNEDTRNPTNSILLFIDKVTNALISTKKFSEETWMHSMSVCQHNPKILLECYRSADSSFLNIRKYKTTLRLKDEYLMFLLHLNEDFDDDLLQDTINLLGFE